jgi:uncharacterized protein YcbK (DUF882 family)
MHSARDWRKRALGALAIALYMAPGSAAPEPGLAGVRAAAAPKPVAPPEESVFAAPAKPPKPIAAWATALDAIEVEYPNTRARASVRLYADDGTMVPEAFDAFARAVSEDGGPCPIAPRLVQLALRSAYAMNARRIVVISAYRPTRNGTGGYHATGEAIDYQLVGVDARKLAAHLRSYPRAGVGVYTNARTQYVHLDIRDASYHWIDGSPPGVTWREAQIRDLNREKRDASYVAEMDLPILLVQKK